MVMVPRILDASASDFARMNGADLKVSIRAAEGRTLAAEVICTDAPPVDGITQGELACAMGADMVILDRFDSLNPRISGLSDDFFAGDAAPLLSYKKLLGRPVGINMIVAEQHANLGGRLATAEHFERAADQGADIIFLYARPGIGGTPALQHTIARQAAQILGNRTLLIGVPSFTQPPPRQPAIIASYQSQIDALLAAGCHGIGMPHPGTKQGWTVDAAMQLVDHIHAGDGLAWSFITGSIEGAQSELMLSLALLAKQIGVDAVRLDEAGLSGMPEPENILAFSLAFRGKRHTYRRMAMSALR
jgi:hypothetical protein